MSSVAWPPTVVVLVESVARLLDSNERDAVLGDSLEAGEGPGQALFSILDLVLRRQLLLWRSWRPWLAAFGFAVPCTWLLMTVSLSVACTSERLLGMSLSQWAPTGHEGIVLLLCQLFLLIAWSWTSGFAIGSLSPRTLWTSAALFLLLAQYLHHMCIVARPLEAMHGAAAGALFPGLVIALAWLAPFLFLLPAIWGVRHGMRTLRLNFGPAGLLAATMAVLMLAAWTSNALWIFNWLLLVPALYLLATARRSRTH